MSRPSRLVPVSNTDADGDAADASADAYETIVGRATSRFTVRGSEFIGHVSPAESVATAEEFIDAIAPFASAGVAVNFLSQEGDERVKAAYGANYERLVTLKNKYDPENLFQMNQNIEPSVH